MTFGSTYENGVLRQRWDGDSRTYTEWDETGTVVVSRPYTQAENDQADAEADQNARLDSIEDRLNALEQIVLDKPGPG